MKTIKKYLLVLLILAIPTVSFAITDINNNRLPFEMAIPNGWEKTQVEKIIQDNKAVPQMQVIQSFYSPETTYPRLAIYDNNTPLKKVTNSYQAEAFVKMVDASKINTKLTNNLNSLDENFGKAQILGASFDKERNIVFTETKFNYKDTGNIITTSVGIIRDGNNNIVIAFTSLESEYKKDRLVFNNIVDSIKFSPNNNSIAKTITSTPLGISGNDLVAFITGAVPIILIIIFVFIKNRFKSSKSTKK